MTGPTALPLHFRWDRWALLLAVLVAAGWLLGVWWMPAPMGLNKDELWHAWSLSAVVGSKAPLYEVWFLDRTYPPLYYLFAYGSGRLLGSIDRLALTLPNLIALLGLLACFRSILDSRSVGLFRSVVLTAVLALCFLPFAWRIAPDQFLASSVFFAIWALYRWRSHPSLGGLLLVLLSLSIAGLVREYAALFLAVPFLVACRRGVGLRASTSLFLTGVLAALVVLLTFHSHFGIVKQVAWAFERGSYSGHWYQGEKPASLAFYPKTLAALIGCPLALGLFYRLKRWDLLAALLPISLMSLVFLRNPEYVAPTLPLFLLATASGELRSWVGPRKVLATALVLVSLAQPAWILGEAWFFGFTYTSRNELIFDQFTASLQKECPEGCSIRVLSPFDGTGTNLVRVGLLRRGGEAEPTIKPELGGAMIERLTRWRYRSTLFPVVPDNVADLFVIVRRLRSRTAVDLGQRLDTAISADLSKPTVGEVVSDSEDQGACVTDADLEELPEFWWEGPKSVGVMDALHRWGWRIAELAPDPSEEQETWDVPPLRLCRIIARDGDGDGFSEIGGDCDDNNPRVWPGAEEYCDELDNDCNGKVDDHCHLEDGDGDGVTAKEGDCDDTNPNIYLGAPELHDGLDNDCDTFVDEIFDRDGDSFTTAQGDCVNVDPSIYPGAPEICDGLDNDCNGLVDGDAMGEIDADGDGRLSCEDCDDTDPNRFPGNVERCDAIDHDCDETVNDVEGCSYEQAMAAGGDISTQDPCAELCGEVAPTPLSQAACKACSWARDSREPPSPPPALPKNPAGYSVIPVMERSSLSFALSKDGGERVDGVFQVVLGGFHLDPTDLSKITGQLNVELGSINTGNKVRDKNIADVFFGRAAGKTVHGNVEFLTITPGVKALGVGKSTVAEAHLRITIGSHGSSNRVPVSLSRPSEEEWLLETMGPVSLSITAMEMTGPAAALKELCGHESIGDLIEVDAAIHLEAVD